MNAYRKAIHEVVRLGDIVMDIGAGAGILSFHACSAGASKVYAVERTEIANLIELTAAENGVADRVSVHRASSFDVTIPERADVVVASMLDSFGIDNNILGTAIDARARLLKPGGTIVPSALAISYCPVEIQAWYDENIGCWDLSRFGFSFGCVRSVAANQTGAKHLEKSALLSDPRTFAPINLNRVNSANVSDSTEFLVERPGTFHALAGWFDCEMTGSVRCGNSPFDPDRLPWANFLMPIEQPVRVEEGDRIETTVREVTHDQNMTWAWAATVRGSDGAVKASINQSSLKGMLLTKKDLNRLRASYVPRLSRRGKAASAALQNCDGDLSLAKIATRVQSRFPELFTNEEAARQFVNSLLDKSMLEITGN
jgi:SAM-dependent methyltransferase